MEGRMIITIDQWTSLEFKQDGKWGWQLTEGYMGKDGEFHPKFCKREFGKDKTEKTAPLSIKFGNDPVKALTELLNAIEQPF
jgi:hypothetical protein